MSSLTARVREFVSGSTDVEIEPAASDAVELAEEIAQNPQTVALPDGRDMGYAETGDPDGDPLFLFHGFPNSRVFGALLDEPGREHGIRVITPERPGMGVSTPDPDRKLIDWPADVAAVAESLDVDTFSVLGISGGGPYAAVTAAELPERVDRAGIGCGLAPMASVGIRDRLWYYLARFAGPGSKLLLWQLGRQARGDREAFLEEMGANAGPLEDELWTGEVGKVLHASMIECTRHHGLDPLVTETAIYGSRWGFDLADITVPTYLWYGKADTLVPPEMGLYLAKEIPTAEAHIYPDYGHLSVITENETAIVDALGS